MRQELRPPFPHSRLQARVRQGASEDHPAQHEPAHGGPGENPKHHPVMGRCLPQQAGPPGRGQGV